MMTNAHAAPVTSAGIVRTPEHIEAIRDARSRLASELWKLRKVRRMLSDDEAAFMATRNAEGVGDFELFSEWRESRRAVETRENQAQYAADRLDYLTGDYD